METLRRIRKSDAERENETAREGREPEARTVFLLLLIAFVVGARRDRSWRQFDLRFSERGGAGVERFSLGLRAAVNAPQLSSATYLELSREGLAGGRGARAKEKWRGGESERKERERGRSGAQQHDSRLPAQERLGRSGPKTFTV